MGLRPRAASRLAALDGATGTGVGRRTQRHRSEDGGAVLNPEADGIDPETDVPGILDTLSAPTSARVPAGRTAHPNGIVPVTPTAAVGMHAVAGFVSTRASQRLKTALVAALEACIAAVEGSIAHPDAHAAQPCRWSRDPGDRAASWTRGHRRVQEVDVSV